MSETAETALYLREAGPATTSVTDDIERQPDVGSRPSDALRTVQAHSEAVARVAIDRACARGDERPP